MSEDTPKIYTKTGDLGETSLIGGKRVSKSDLRLNAYGTVDELNAFIGLLVAQIGLNADLKKDEKLNSCTELLIAIQSSLFDVGSHLACENEQLSLKMPKLNLKQVALMEEWIDLAQTDLKALKNFILPGGTLQAAQAHVCRTLTRRAERVIVALSKKAHVDPEIVVYLNRLSDFLFVVSRYLNFIGQVDDVIWSARSSTAK